jgi:hypothetical protein
MMSQRSWHTTGILVLIIATWLVWWPTLRGGFVADDFPMLYLVRHPKWFWILIIPGATWFWRPMSVYLYNAVLLNLFGLNPPVFKAGLLLFETANTLLVASLGQRLSGSGVVGFTAGLLYTLHLSHLETRLMVTNAGDILAAFGFFAAMASYLRARAVPERTSWRWLTLSVLFCLFGLLSKETLVVFPLVLLWYEIVYHPPKWHSLSRWMVNRWPLLPFILLVAGFGLLRVLMFHVNPGELYRFSFNWRWTLLALQYWWWGITLWLAQWNPALGYWDPPRLGWSAIIFATLASIAIWSKRRGLIFGLGWCLLTLFPYVLLPNHVYPHFLIIPLMGFGLVVGELVLIVGQAAQAWLGKRVVMATGILLACLAVLAGSLVVKRQTPIHYRAEWAQFADCALRLVQTRFPTLPHASRLYFRDFSKPHKIAIFGGAMFNLYRGDLKLRSIFVPDPEPAISWPFAERSDAVPPDAPFVVSEQEVLSSCSLPRR